MENTIIAQIESWEIAQINEAMASLKSNKTLEASILARYQHLLDVLDGKSLKALADFPKKWDKLSTEKKAQVIAAHPAGIPFFVTNINLNAHLRVDTWRDSHYKHQIPELPENLGNLKNVKELHLKYQLIKNIPDFIGDMESLEVLDLQENKLNELPESILKLSNLRVLILEQNYGMKTLPDISKLEKLEVVDFTYTDISELPEGFYSLKHIKEITTKSSDLEKNLSVIRRLIQSFPNATINTNAREAIELEDNRDENEFKGKEKIRLSESSLNYLPENLFDADMVKILEIRCWNLKELPDTFDRLQTLEELKMDVGNDIEELPASIFRLKNLKSLSIECHGIKVIPDCMEGLESLEDLTLNHLKLEHVPTSLARIPKLKNLYLEYCSCNAFEVIATIKKLEKLEVKRYHTPFFMPAAMTELTELRSFIFHFQQPITDEIFNLPRNIQKLNIYDDCWGEKKSKFSLAKILKHFNHVEKLELNYIDLSDISEPISPNSSLKELALFSSKMNALPDSISNLQSLTYLCLFDCPLIELNPALYDCPLEYLRTYKTLFESLPEGISKMTNLKRIGFERAQLKRFPTDIVALKHLEKISLEDTPIMKDKDYKAALKKKIKGLKIVKAWYD